ncbi:class I SAM-dependent methyltransferase [Pseudooceanicola aestuarii]|uniref:class I SAM-dependent methyltransferase n=1 Tax=Pseudooceanicola aestuarii TaxID=2697319 RepID=UPI0013D76DA5|nr:class I SAM-dependent methyltransferase [Pseudooceanicola aestuarii]
MKDATAFWDGMARSYADRPISDPAAYDRTLDRVRSYLAPSDRVLEVGAGTGTTAIRLRPHVGSYEATDLSDNLIQIARQRAAEADAAPITFRTADLMERPEGAPYDVVMAFNLLHLVEDIDTALAHLAGLVKPGGYVITKSACLGSGLHWMRPMIWVMQQLGRAPYVAFRNVEELQNAVERQGLKILETGNYPARPINRFIVAQKV